MPTVEHFALLLGFAALAFAWWYSDTKLARTCGVCGGPKEPAARWCDNCEREVSEWLV